MGLTELYPLRTPPPEGFCRVTLTLAVCCALDLNGIPGHNSIQPGHTPLYNKNP